MFKQAGGRAGRRGYDSAGHIIFWEVPFRRINRLLEARLPVFSGDFPVTPMLGTLEALCVQEHLSQTEREQLLLQVLAICCDPSNSSEIPSNFVLQQVLQHRREVSRYRILQYASATNDAAALGAAVAASQQTRADLRPFTQRFPRPLEEAVEAFNRLVQQCCLQSPFAAMSCLQDSQVSLSSEMLQDSLRMHLPFQPEVMCAMCPLEVQRFPVFDPAAGRTTFVEVYRKNSYLRDLYLHGKLTRVVSENGIAPESLWKLLHHFVGSLRHLQEGLQVLELQDGTAGAHLALSVARLHARMKEVLVEESA
ncbi:uncharacterized helicase C28H8.3 [Cyclospora cayetanensis]|uniref:Uncharacterized helicase C28H8.3 n=1 Tax=Cyclospora cayetanensis TaxID=88456 RepID=A0A6P6RW67_9EIME|nr:uncharacterized helicase C28H8.3 [Cyclospora cayetanensis]